MNMKTMNPDTAFDQVLYLVVITYYIKKLFKKDSTILPETKGIEKSIKSNDFLLKLFCRIFGSGSRKLKSWIRKNKSATLEKVHCFKWLNFHFCELENSRLFAEYFVPIGGITFSGL